MKESKINWAKAPKRMLEIRAIYDALDNLKKPDKDPFYMLEQKEKETRNLLFSVLTENARLIEDNKRLRKELVFEKRISIYHHF